MASCLSLGDSASDWVNKLLNRDGQFRDVAIKVNYSCGEPAGVSGFTETDYAALSTNLGGDLEFEKTTSLPSELLEKFSSLTQCCCMGVFPQCGKAWLTIDKEFFTWNYEDGEDLAFYDGCSDVIISVSLMKPKPVLPTQIEFLLCLAMENELIILGVTYDYSTSQDGRSCPGVLQVIPIPLYRLSTEGHYTTCMESTPDGRLFLGDREGDLLEVLYDAISSFHLNSELPANHISGPCSLKNHSASSLSFLLPSILTSGFRPSGAITQIAVDVSRGLFYTLSENSHLAVYQFTDAYSKPNSTYLTKLTSLSGSELASRAHSVARSIDRQHFTNLVSVICLPGEGAIQLMAVTSSGVRIYFSSNLRIAHVRLPPCNSPVFDYETGLPKGVSSPFNVGEVKLVAETRGSVIFASMPIQQQQHQITTTSASGVAPLSPPSMYSSSGIQQTVNRTSTSLDGLHDSTNTDELSSSCLLSVISPDPFPWSPGLTESHSVSLSVQAPWAIIVLPSGVGSGVCGSSGTEESAYAGSISEIASGVSKSSFNRRGIDLPHEVSPDESTTVLPTSVARGPPPVVLTQHLDPPYRRILVIAAHGILHFRLMSPMQRLREFLMNTSLANQGLLSGMVLRSQPIGDENLTPSVLPAFLHQFGPDEAICVAFAIASDAFREGVDSDWAANCHAFQSSDATGGLVERAEQAAMFFAAEATRFWQPPVSRESLIASPMTSRGNCIFPQSVATTPGSVQEFELESTAAGAFLLIGASLFLSRVARLVWRAPMFAIADKALLIEKNGGAASGGVGWAQNPVGGLRSLLHSFITTTISKASSRDSDEDSILVTSRLNSDDLGWLLHQLHYLKNVLNRQLQSRNSWFRLPPGQHSSVGPAADSFGRMAVSSNLSRLAQDLVNLVSGFIEFVGLWQVISQHSVPSIVKRLSMEQRSDLLTLPVEAFVCWMPRAAYPPSLPSELPAYMKTSGTSSEQLVFRSPQQKQPQQLQPAAIMDLRSSLITALIEHYFVEDGDLDGRAYSVRSIDTLSTRLRIICPNLFANEDALCAKAEELLVRASSQSSPRSEAAGKFVLEAADLLAEAGGRIDIGLAVRRLINSVGAWPVAANLCLSVAQRRDPNDVAVACLREGRLPSASEMQFVESRYDAYRHLLDGLNRLLVAACLPAASAEIPFSEAEEKSDEPINDNRSSLAIGPNPTPLVARSCLLLILRSIIKSEDILAHFELIGWLLSNGLIEQVVALNSPHLESYLRSRLRQSPNDVSLRCLLWRQLEARGARLEAAKVLEHLATAPSPELDLENRLDYLARAIITVKALPPAQQDPDYLVELQDCLDTAELQRQLSIELVAFDSPDANISSLRGLEESIRELTHGPLLSLSDLFTRFADPFDLHESKLLLLRFAGEADTDLVHAIWLALLHRLLVTPNSVAGRLPMGHGGFTRRVELSLTSSLARLYSRLVSSSPLILSSGPGVDYSFFPLAVIISTLERYAIQQMLPVSWVPSVLSGAKIPPSAEIVEAYNIVLCSKDSMWRCDQVRVRLIETIQIIISDFLAISGSLPPRQRQLQASRLLDHLTTHLVEMHSEPSSGYRQPGQQRGSDGTGGPAADLSLSRDHLVERLRSLRGRLDRLAVGH